MLGALSPDVDFLLMPVGWDVYLRFHAIGTHSLVGALGTGLGSALIVKAIARRTPYRVLASAAVFGAFSHIVADVVSGGRLSPAWPLSDAIPFAPLVAMADPWTIGILLIGAAAVWWWRQRRRTAASAVLGVLGLFLAFKGLLLAAALSRSTFDQGAAVSRIVEAEWGSLTRWHVFDRTPLGLRHWTVDAGGQSALVLARALSEETPLVTASRSLTTVQRFLRVHDLTFAVLQPSSDGVFVLWSDIRFCRRSASGSTIDCDLWFGGLFTPDGRVVREQVRVGAWWLDRMPRSRE